MAKPCPDEIVAESKSEVRPGFSEQIQATIQHNEQSGKALRGQAQMTTSTLSMGNWDGDLNNVEGIGEAFDRTEIEADLNAAISDAESPGVVGDLVATSLQGDHLATQERSFRNRHLTPVRRMMHASARMSGHGHEAGLYRRGIIGTAEGILKQAKDQ